MKSIPQLFNQASLAAKRFIAPMALAATTALSGCAGTGGYYAGPPMNPRLATAFAQAGGDPERIWDICRSHAPGVTDPNSPYSPTRQGTGLLRQMGVAGARSTMGSYAGSGIALIDGVSKSTTQMNQNASRICRSVHQFNAEAEAGLPITPQKVTPVLRMMSASERGRSAIIQQNTNAAGRGAFGQFLHDAVPVPNGGLFQKGLGD